MNFISHGELLGWILFKASLQRLLLRGQGHCTGTVLLTLCGDVLQDDRLTLGRFVRA
jgi:hypothetical protein